VAAAAGNNVNLVDVNDSILQKSQVTIEKSLSRIVKKLFKVSSLKTQNFSSIRVCYMYENPHEAFTR
jgi:3-hydroxyacyl-CoA dehydrogenase